MSRINLALHELRTLEDLASRDTALSRVDARALTLTTLAFIIVVVSYDRHSVAALLPLALYPIVLAVLGDVPARSVLRKLLIAAPFAVMVGLFNPLIDTAPAATIGTVTIAAGWLSFASIIVRFALTVSAAIAMVAGTGLHGLCSALGRLGVPPVFTAQLLFMMRYVFVLGGEASRMVTARELRSAGRRARLSEYGPLVGHMLLRAFERAQRIHLAMIARGFDGEVRGLKPLRWRMTDTWFTLGWCAFFLAVRIADFPQLVGRALLGVVS